MVFSGDMTPRSFVRIAALCALALTVLSSTHAEAAAPSTTPCGVSKDDQRSGIRAVDDSTCIKGGLGCYNDHCRFCKVLDTPQATHFLSCSSLGAVFPTAAPLVAPTTPCQVSRGDAAVGISAVSDPNCLYGGLGCFQGHCRYCKVKTTPQSAGFTPCSSFNTTANVPVQSTQAPAVATVAPVVTTAAPVVTTETPIVTTEAPGVTTAAPAVATVAPIVTTETPIVTTEAPIVTTETPIVTTEAPAATTETPIVTTEAPAVPTEAPIVTTEAPIVATASPTASTETPVSTTAAPASPATCTLVPTAGDIVVGVGIATDLSCQSGGSGCISDICRFCKVMATVQSAAYIDCVLIAGFTPVSDASTEAPNATTNSPVSTTDAPVTTTEAPIVDTEAPISTTDTPVVTTEAPAVTTEAPVPTTESPATTTESPALTTDAPAPQSSCSLVAAADDVAAGINIVTDPTCQSGGAGCINDICRFCKVTTSVQSATLFDCALFGGAEPTSEPPTASTAPPSDTVTETPDSTTDAPVSTTDAPISSTETPGWTTDAPDATIEAPVSTTEAPVSTTEAPVSTTETPDATTDAPVSTTESPVAQPTCGTAAAAGDVAVGVSIVTDLSCSSGGVGCIDDVCRFCKVRTSTQSAAFVDCASIVGATVVSDAPSATAGSTTGAPALTTCSLVASSGDAAVGISIGTDPTCSLGGVGCIDDVCRFCKMATSTQSASFVDCTSTAAAFPSSEAPIDTTPSPTDAITDPPAPQASCSQVVSEGDAAVGINIVADASCRLGGVGCIDNVCRFCKVTTSVQSASFVDCASIAGATLSTKAPADTTTTPSVDSITSAPAPQASCNLVVSEGDAAVGIDIVADASCHLGGVGCIDDVCRFCKVTSSVQSAALINCASIATPATSSATTSSSSATPDAATPGVADVPTEAPDTTSDAGGVASADTPDATNSPDSTTTDSPDAGSDMVDDSDSDAADWDASDDSGDDTAAPDHPSDLTDTPTDASDATDASGEMDTPAATSTPGATTADISDTTTSTTTAAATATATNTTANTTGTHADDPDGLSSDVKDDSDDSWYTDVSDDASGASSESMDFDLDF